MIIILVIANIVMMMTVIIIAMSTVYSGNDTNKRNTNTVVPVHNDTTPVSLCSNYCVDDVNFLNNNCQTSLHCLMGSVNNIGVKTLRESA